MFRYSLIDILYVLPGILIGISFHEFAHAYASHKLGDPTPEKMGRLTISPSAHIDPIGFLMLILGGFGWAKPVAINPTYYKKPRSGQILVSIAGPITNYMIALIFSVGIKILITFNDAVFLSAQKYNILLNLLFYTVQINLVLFVFNLLPIPPLDGFHILQNILPYRYARQLYYIERYGFILLIVFILSGAASYILGPAVSFFLNSIKIILGLF